MTTPYKFASSRNLPRAPHPTPVSASASSRQSTYVLGNPRIAKAPVYNPYDKFSQSEFDLWIGGITGALRHALGQETKPPQDKQSPPESYRDVSRSESEDVSEDEQDPDDSFAEFKARRARLKGKARDPRDGPGLSGGNKDQPIEIDFDSDHAEEDVSKERYSHELNSGSDDSERANSQIQDDEISSDVIYDEEGELEESKDDYMRNEEEEEVEDEYEIEVQVPGRMSKADNAIEIISDEENPNEEDEIGSYLSEEGSDDGLPISVLPPSRVSRLLVKRYMDEEPLYEEEHDDEGRVQELDELSDDEVIVLEDEYETIQPLANDTSFPPHPPLPSPKERRPIELPDPWEGPQTYAEDYYSGGDVQARSRDVNISADRLGPYDEGVPGGGDKNVLKIEDTETLAEDHLYQENEVILLDPDHCVNGVSTHYSISMVEHKEGTLAPRETSHEPTEMYAEGEILTPYNPLSFTQHSFTENVSSTRTEFPDHDDLPASSPILSSPIEQFTVYDDKNVEPLDLEALYDDMIAEEQEDEQVRALTTTESKFDIVDAEEIRANEISSSIDSVASTPKNDEEAEYNIMENNTEAGEDNSEDLDDLGGVLPLGTSELSVEEVSFEEGPNHEFQHDPNVFITGNVEEHENTSGFEEPVPVSIDDAVSENMSSVELMYPRDISMTDSEPVVHDLAIDAIDITPIDEIEFKASNNVEHGEEISRVSPEVFTPDFLSQPEIQEILVEVVDQDNLFTPELNDSTQDQDNGGVPLPEASQNVFDQLPTPPSEKYHGSELPSETIPQDNPIAVYKSQKVEIEEIPDEDAPPWPFQGISDVAGDAENFFLPADVEFLDDVDVAEERQPVYTVIEAMDDNDGLTEEDADGDNDMHLDIVSVSSGGFLNDVAEQNDVTVEELMTETEGRLTEGLTSRATSMGLKINDQETVTTLASPAPAQVQLPVEHDIGECVEGPASQSLQPIDQSQSGNEAVKIIDPFDSTSTILSPEASETKDMHETQPSRSRASSDLHPKHIPIPAYADAPVHDLTERPFTPLLLGSTPTFVLSPVGTPGQGPVPVSIPMPQSVIKKMRLQANEQPHPHIDPRLLTSNYASLPRTPEAVLVPQTTEGLDRHFGTGDSSIRLDDEDPFSIIATTSVTPETFQPAHVREDEFKNASPDFKSPMKEFTHSSPKRPSDQQLPSTSPPHNIIPPTAESRPEVSKSATFSPQQPPFQQTILSHPMAVVMHKSSHPVLFPDPFPYSLSTPPVNVDSLNDGSEVSKSTSLSVQQPSFQQTNSNHLTGVVHPMGVVMRKSSHPVLFSDPFPYSLSTPSTNALNSLNDGSEEDIEMDNSLSSSSTVDKDVDAQGTDINPNLDELELQYPSNPDVPYSGLPISNPPGIKRVVNEDPHRPRGSKPDALKSPLPTGILYEEDPFKLMGTESTVAPGPVKETFGVKKFNASRTLTPKKVAIKLPLRTESENDADNSLITSKRKRASSPGSVAIQSSLKSGRKKTPKKDKPKSPETIIGGDTIHVKPKNKGKGKGKDPMVLRRASLESWSSSGASTAARMLQPNSRASSISSSAPSDKSLHNHPSPTVNKPGTFTIRIPPPLFHAHGRARANLTQPLPPSRKASLDSPKTPSLSRISDATTSSSRLLSPTVSLQSGLSQRYSSGSKSFTSTPVTRSHCRYHKISMPKEEGGPRVTFLVPGCSLVDHELMEEEEIEDHGLATNDDAERLIEDIESLKFNPYLIGILRQLVGVDILREQEVFYLPQPGEEHVRRSRKSAPEKSAMIRATSATEHTSTAGSPGVSARSPVSPKAPLSATGSMSSLPHHTSEKDSASVLSDAESQMSADNVAPKRKRARPTPPSGQPGTMGPPDLSSIRPLRNQRRNRPSIDNSAQKPVTDEEYSSDDVDSPLNRRKKRILKRSRTSDVMATDGVDVHKTKKQKMHPLGIVD